jgi:hypothetical protein
MAQQPLFDVILHVFGDTETGAGIYDVSIIDRYHKRGDIIGQTEANSLDEALEFARGAVTAFMEGTRD